MALIAYSTAARQVTVFCGNTHTRAIIDRSYLNGVIDAGFQQSSGNLWLLTSRGGQGQLVRFGKTGIVKAILKLPAKCQTRSRLFLHDDTVCVWVFDKDKRVETVYAAVPGHNLEPIYSSRSWDNVQLFLDAQRFLAVKKVLLNLRPQLAFVMPYGPGVGDPGTGTTWPFEHFPAVTGLVEYPAMYFSESLGRLALTNGADLCVAKYSHHRWSQTQYALYKWPAYTGIDAYGVVLRKEQVMVGLVVTKSNQEIPLTFLARLHNGRLSPIKKVLGLFARDLR